MPIAMIGIVLLISITTLVRNANAISANPENLQAAVTSNNQFAFDLLRQHDAGDGNLFISPTSITSVLAMVYAGADNETKKQIQEALNLLSDDGKVHDGFAQLMSALNDSSNVEMSVANRIWIRDGMELAAEFKQIMNASYDAPFTLTDFSKVQDAVNQINQWVEGATNERIKDLLTTDDVDGSTSMVLTNAIYFKGNWVSKFNPRLTRDDDFTGLGGGVSQIPMMNQRNEFLFGKFDQGKILEMPYQGDRYSMVYLLPENDESFETLKQEMDDSTLAKLLSQMARKKVQVRIPKFKSELKIKLADTLRQLGIIDAFQANADFSKMTSSEALYLDEVIHKTFIQIDEEGSEAAGATAGIMKRATAIEPDVEEFFADKPFFYMIRDRQTGAILFLGTMTGPAGT